MTDKTILAFRGGSPMGRDNDAMFKDGAPSEHALGVLYQGPWSDEADGFNEHVRRCARALALTGCPVHLRSFAMPMGAQSLSQDIAKMLTTSIGMYSVLIHQLVATNPDAIHRLTAHRHRTPEENAFLNSFRVVYTVWERDRVQDGYVRALNRVAQAWVACRANAEMLEVCGVEADRIRVVPVPYFQDDPLLALRTKKRQKGPVRFYHIGKWEPRKAQDKILLGFLKAFRPKEAHLVIKSSALRFPIQGYPISPEEALVACLNDPDVLSNGWTESNVKDAVEIIARRITHEAIVGLHRFGDVYVTLSRGEGFDMPAFDAKLAGNLMMYTPSGGPQDFAGETDVLVAPSGALSCHPFYQWEPDAMYLDYDLRDVVHAFRTAHGRAIHDRNNRDLTMFSAERVGQSMLENLNQIVANTVGKVF